MKLEIKEIAKNLVVNTNKGFNTDLFKSDVEIIEDSIDNYLNDCNNYISFSFETTTDKVTNEINGTKETFICLYNYDVFLITAIEQKGYNGEIEEVIYSKWLTLQGFNYFTRKLLEEPTTTEEEEINILEMSNIYYQKEIENNLCLELDIQDLLSIAENKENYLQVKFIINFKEYRINFNLKGQLTSYSKHDIDTKEEYKTSFRRRGSKI